MTTLGTISSLGCQRSIQNGYFLTKGETMHFSIPCIFSSIPWPDLASNSGLSVSLQGSVSHTCQQASNQSTPLRAFNKA